VPRTRRQLLQQPSGRPNQHVRPLAQRRRVRVRGPGAADQQRVPEEGVCRELARDLADLRDGWGGLA
jgi:hypothetical protein